MKELQAAGRWDLRYALQVSASNRNPVRVWASGFRNYNECSLFPCCTAMKVNLLSLVKAGVDSLSDFPVAMLQNALVLACVRLLVMIGVGFTISGCFGLLCQTALELAGAKHACHWAQTAWQTAYDALAH